MTTTTTTNDNDIKEIERLVDISIKYMNNKFGTINYAEFNSKESAEMALGMFRERGFRAYRVNSHIRFAK